MALSAATIDSHGGWLTRLYGRNRNRVGQVKKIEIISQLHEMGELKKIYDELKARHNEFLKKYKEIGEKIDLEKNNIHNEEIEIKKKKMEYRNIVETVKKIEQKKSTLEKNISEIELQRNICDKEIVGLRTDRKNLLQEIEMLRKDNAIVKGEEKLDNLWRESPSLVKQQRGKISAHDLFMAYEYGDMLPESLSFDGRHAISFTKDRRLQEILHVYGELIKSMHISKKQDHLMKLDDSSADSSLFRYKELKKNLRKKKSLSLGKKAWIVI